MAVMNYSCLRMNSFASGANHPGVHGASSLFLPHKHHISNPSVTHRTVIMYYHILFRYFVHMCFLAKENLYWNVRVALKSMNNC